MRKNIDNLVLWFVIIFLLFLTFGRFDYSSVNGSGNKSFSELMDLVNAGGIESVSIKRDEVKAITKSGEKFYSTVILYNGFIDDLRKNGVFIEIDNKEGIMSILGGILFSWFPVLLLIGVWIFFVRQMQSGGKGAMSFGKSRARLMKDKKKVTFSDVAGIDEAKEEVVEIVDFLMDPSKFKELGGKIPKGCLLVGPPGTGKTLLAKAIAGEAKVPFFSISGSDFVEMFVGVGASRVRDMFEQGKKNAPCIIFIDEIDAVGRHRGAGMGGGNDEREQTLNQLLVEMDGFEENNGVIIIAATNRPDVLDNALLRPGRFDRQVVVNLPDIKGREEILKVHISKVKVGFDVSANVLARGTPGFSGADLYNLINEAALMAARHNKQLVTHEDFDKAKDKVMMGTERKSLTMKEEERKLTAYHEAGHAIVSLKQSASDPIYKATIIPRGRALGVVMRLPEEDKVSLTKEKIIADITVAMGGRVAEEIIFGIEKITSGAESDIKQATGLARSMIMKWGMNGKVGLVFHNEDRRGSISDEMSGVIDNEVKDIIDAAYTEANRILNENMDFLHLLSKSLLEHETLTGDEIKDLMDGKEITKESSEGENTGSSML